MQVIFSGKRLGASKKTLTVFVSKICRELKWHTLRSELNIVLISDREIRKLKKTFYHIDRATDVIAFNYSHFVRKKEKGLAVIPFADIFVSVDTARRQALEGGHSLLQETALLIMHGMLHIAGYRDHTARARNKMFAEQRALFRKLAPDLAPADFR